MSKLSLDELHQLAVDVWSRPKRHLKMQQLLLALC